MNALIVYAVIALAVWALWIITAKASCAASKIKLPKVELPPYEPTPETAADRYHAQLHKLDNLPLTDDERELCIEAARRKYINEA